METIFSEPKVTTWMRLLRSSELSRLTLERALIKPKIVALLSEASTTIWKSITGNSFTWYRVVGSEADGDMCRRTRRNTVSSRIRTESITLEWHRIRDVSYLRTSESPSTRVETCQLSVDLIGAARPPTDLPSPLRNRGK